MTTFLIRCFIFLFLCTGCTGRAAPSDLTKALSAAVKDEKISERTKVKILEEYEMLREEDKEKAREYVLQVITAIKMGADSSHIDVVRHQFAPLREGA